MKPLHMTIQPWDSPQNLLAVVNTVKSRGGHISRWNQATGRKFLGLTEEEGEDKWEGPFFFAVMADTQLGAMDDNTVGGHPAKSRLFHPSSSDPNMVR